MEEEGEEGGLSWSVWLVGVAVAKANSELRCEVRASLRQGLGTKLSLVWFFFQQGQEVDTVWGQGHGVVGLWLVPAGLPSEHS